jgi:hypothetical protein
MHFIFKVKYCRRHRRRRRRHHHHHPLSLLNSSLAGSQNSTSLTDQALLIHCSAKKFLTIYYALLISAVEYSETRLRRPQLRKFPA